MCGSNFSYTFLSFSWIMISPFESSKIANALKMNPLCVADIGAAGGIDPLWFRYGNNRCLRFFGFEPNPENFLKLQNNSNTQYFQMAIASRRGSGDFYAHSTVGSLSRRPDREEIFGEKYEKLKVQIETLEHLRDSGIIPSLDVVKTDIEEHDIEAIQGIGQYLSEEPLYIKSEFHFYRNITFGNFSRIDDLLTANGLLLFGIQSKLGSCGELEGGDLLYLRSIDQILSSPCNEESKKVRVLKLIAICFFIRNANYAYICVRAAGEAGVLSSGEVEEVIQLIEHKVFLPSVLPKFWVGRTVTHLLTIFLQLLTGKAWTGKSSPRHNRLDEYAPLFVNKVLLPGLVKRGYRQWLDERYDRYVKRRSHYYQVDAESDFGEDSTTKK